MFSGWYFDITFQIILIAIAIFFAKQVEKSDKKLMQKDAEIWQQHIRILELKNDLKIMEEQIHEKRRTTN